MSLPERKQRIAASFGAAADGYERAAVLQRHAARRLAERVFDLPLPSRFRVLEVGAGTGLLTRLLLDRLGGREWVVTDLSEEMLKVCRQSLGPASNLTFRRMDGEKPDVDGPFDLIVSNLAFQWFDDLEGALARLATLLAPGGHLAFTTMARDSAREWRRAHACLGLHCGTPVYPALRELQAAWPAGGEGRFEDEHFVRHYHGARAFVRSLKRTGAMVASDDHRPLSPASFRRLLRELDLRGNLAVTYHLAYGVFTKDGEVS